MVRARDRCADVYCDATTQQLAKHKVLHLCCSCTALHTYLYVISS